MSIKEDSHTYFKPEWFSQSALIVAPALIGCRITRQLANGTLLSGMIAETEAYLETDPACHTYRGKTPRNEVMFGPAGHAYVYFIYGMHHCLNVVTGKVHEGEAVLIRALELEDDFKIASGPGKLARYLDIDLSWNGVEFHPRNMLWIAPAAKTAVLRQLVQTPRIGISKATDLPWRWCLAHSPAVTSLRQQKLKRKQEI